MGTLPRFQRLMEDTLVGFHFRFQFPTSKPLFFKMMSSLSHLAIEQSRAQCRKENHTRTHQRHIKSIFQKKSRCLGWDLWDSDDIETRACAQTVSIGKLKTGFNNSHTIPTTCTCGSLGTMTCFMFYIESLFHLLIDSCCTNSYFMRLHFHVSISGFAFKFRFQV